MWGSSTTGTEAVLVPKLWWTKPFWKKKNKQKQPVQDFNLSHQSWCNTTASQTLKDFGAFPKKPHLVWEEGRRDVLPPLPPQQSPLGHSWSLILGSWLQQAKFWVGRRVEHISPTNSFTSVPCALLKGQGQGLCVTLCCPGWGQSPLSLTPAPAKNNSPIHKMTIHPGLLSNSPPPPLWSFKNIFLATFNSTTPVW